MFEQHGAFAARILRSLGVRDADLDDLLQEVFLVVARRGGDYEELGRARSWMYSICKRVAVAGRRRHLQERAAIATHSSEPACPATQLEHVEDAEALELCERLLNQLPPQQRLIFLLYEVEELSMPEIARQLGCPLQTAYSRLHKARARIARRREQPPSLAKQDL
ncbi:MAG TPA: sigma-70 family RNA polymerase sigma factor [Polyangiales bacterium]|nr:sigma-70 family RNA polymerase sigma factor [Polyangiales bacterium]